MVKRPKLKSVADDRLAARRAERAFQHQQKQHQAKQEAKLTNLAAGLGLTRDGAKSEASVRLAAAKSAQHTMDSYQNFAADNLTSAGTFGFNPISRIHVLLEWILGGGSI